MSFSVWWCETGGKGQVEDGRGNEGQEENADKEAGQGEDADEGDASMQKRLRKTRRKGGNNVNNTIFSVRCFNAG